MLLAVFAALPSAMNCSLMTAWAMMPRTTTVSMSRAMTLPSARGDRGAAKGDMNDSAGGLEDLIWYSNTRAWSRRFQPGGWHRSQCFDAIVAERRLHTGMAAPAR